MIACIIANANSSHTDRALQPLIAHGDEIHLITYQTPRLQYPNVSEVIDLTRFSRTPILRWLQWGFWVRKYIHKLHPDVLHAHQIQAAGWLAFLTDYHPFVLSSWGSDLLLEPHKSVFRRFLVRLVLARCDCLTVPSQTLYQAARGLGVSEGKIRLIPWGIDTQVFKPAAGDYLSIRRELGLPEQAEIIFCPRGISRIYNIDIVISAVKTIIEQHPKLCLLLIRFNVDPKYMKVIQEQIQKEGLNDHVHWILAQSSPEEMARLYQAADIVISIPQSEGYGSSVYEAIACGCATLITDLPAFKDRLNHEIHTLKTPARDVTATSTLLHRLLSDDTLRKTLSKNSIQLLKEESTRSYADVIHHLYHEVQGWKKRT
jgi:glycosyltransferase involved in cell wall biosynthesis